MSLCCRRPGHTPVTSNGWDVGAIARVCKRHGVRYPWRGQNPVDIPGDRRLSPKRTRLLLGFAHLLGMRPNYVAAIQFFRQRHGMLKCIPRLCVACAWQLRLPAHVRREHRRQRMLRCL